MASQLRVSCHSVFAAVEANVGAAMIDDANSEDITNTVDMANERIKSPCRKQKIQ